MTDNWQIIDNFLPLDIFKEIQAGVLAPDFPWSLCPYISHEDDGNTMFVHTVYENNRALNDSVYLFAPLYNALGMNSLLRSKVNLYPRVSRVEDHGYHSDFIFHHSGCVFYFNTCNGYTKIKDGPEVKSVANRALLMDTSIPHTSTGCTDEPFRITMQINYFKSVENPNAICYPEQLRVSDA